jgi:flagellar hook-basal body complex protein FliE
MQVSGIGTIASLQAPQASKKGSATGEGFGDLLSKAINQLAQLESEANNAAVNLATGEPVEIHDVMVAMEQANLGFQLALQVRNKLIDAYQEIMRMPI